MGIFATPNVVKDDKAISKPSWKSLLCRKYCRRSFFEIWQDPPKDWSIDLFAYSFAKKMDLQ